MNKDCKKYLTAIFFIGLFIFAGVGSVVPGLFTGVGDNAFIEKFISAETEDENKSKEEKNEKEVREFYLHDSSGIGITMYNLSVAQTKILAEKNLYKQAVYFAVPTPPPELL